MKLRLGTRGSDLALTQSRWVAGVLAAHAIETELVVISTSGDRSAAPSFGAIGPQGVFVREIEQALIDGTIDCAVHSYKDLPTRSPDSLVVAATPERRDPADWLIYGGNPRAATGGSRIGTDGGNPRAADGASTRADDLLSALPTGARVGTSSARRQAWLKHLRPDLVVEPLRGNVPTRLKRVAAGDFDAIVLAGAGIERLDATTDVLAAALAIVTTERLDPARFVPAPAQGALALQCRCDDQDRAVRDALAGAGDPATAVAVRLEREALALAEGGCDAAFGAWARQQDDGFELIVMAAGDGGIVTARVSGDADADPLAAEALAALGKATGVTG